MNVLADVPISRHLSVSGLVRVIGDWRTRTPAYAALADAVRAGVLSGAVPLGTRLPSERDLAATLGVSRTTTAAAYDLLREQGYAVGRTGVGTVTLLPRQDRPTAQPGIVGGDAPSTDDVVTPDDVIYLSQATPAAPPQLHPAYTRALEALPAYLPGHGYDPLGLQPLRVALAQLYTDRGTPTVPDQILVTTGAQHAISTLLAALVGRGDRVVVQSPTYAHALDAARGAGARLVGVPVGSGVEAPGFDGDLFESTVRQVAPRLVYLVPDHHNPTGYSLTPAEREHVRAVARRHRVTVLGDETLVDIGLDRPGLPEDHGQEHTFCGDGSGHGRVLAIGSASKTFWGGLRVGWIRAHPDLVARLARTRGASDVATSVLEQLAVVELLTERRALLADRVEDLRGRRDTLVDALRATIRDWDVPRPPGGLSLWVGLPSPRAHALVSAAADHGVVINAGPQLTPDGSARDHVRLAYAQDTATLLRAVPRLQAAWRHVAG
ncbi:PLP-dependent aminotransferase family protein [Oerskovia flava]|uniref:MocR-like transcription factor YczR n=1 Tax=Oerskovia flava TaxID=2986422 RepID=UPI00223F0942|nr:PLP-dependent aminotransferase family protein [Oerskovia sp. JB1-3-2]